MLLMRIMAAGAVLHIDARDLAARARELRL